MSDPSPIPRPVDIADAIELIRAEMAGLTLDAFESDRRSAALDQAIQAQAAPGPLVWSNPLCRDQDNLGVAAVFVDRHRRPVSRTVNADPDENMSQDPGSIASKAR
jgi:hypothetical protein